MQWQQEVVDLHRFFEQWFRGELTATDDAFGRFEGVLAPTFRMITPGGVELMRAPLLESLRAAHGARPAIRIGVDAPELLVDLGGSVLVSYREWQEDDGPRTVRVSTALFTEHAGTPHGVVWRHVHETWLP